MKVKILIADDHAIVRTGLRSVIKAEPSLNLVGEATGGLETIELVKNFRPDILLLDLSMPDMDGITVIKSIKPNYPNLKVLFLTIHEDEALLREALRFGASGYILKKAAEAELISAIQTVMRGDLYIDTSLLRQIVQDEVDVFEDVQTNYEPLTPRELDVLKLIARGYTNRQAGEELSISVRTVEGHRANIYKKLGVNSRVELVRFARRHRIID